ncbi:MAG: hydantoinase B/oxoprolinase family protein [Proteobacteria bacterium]|nr:hydantoinase B/oxoprolinase family protein [Pseudomonadota bacterium]
MAREADPVRLEVIKNGFDTIADEMALILMRTAYSPIVRDAMDFSTALCDGEGRTLAQGLTTPLHLGSFFDAMRFLLDHYRGRIFPGDVFIGNDPYLAAGQHLPDIYVARPIFIDGALSGWATTVAHHVDVGGTIPGSNALGAGEIFQEGLRLPFLKLYERGSPNAAIFEIVKANVRTPDLVIGDLEAQIVATTVGEREYVELHRHQGAEAMRLYIEELHDYAEDLARREIAEMPDGVYEFTDQIDGLGETPEPIVFKVKLDIRGEEVSVDWSGTSPQVKGGINAPFPFTKAAAYAALRAVMASDIPNCHGFTRPITVTAPDGTVVKPLPPAACGARGITGFRMIDCLMGALAKATPERVTADGSGGSTLPTFAGTRGGKAFVFSETLMGNTGGSAGHDGQEGVAHIGANQSNVPIELIEASYPIRIELYGFVADSGGAGKHRGGLSIVREYRVLQDETLLSVRSDKRAFPPHGLFGGAAGAPSMNLINPGAGERALPVLMVAPLILGKGALFRHTMAGGGGFGDPLERDPPAVLGDVIAEKVSPAHAAETYGVILRAGAGGGWSLDEGETRRCRDRLRAARAGAGAA